MTYIDAHHHLWDLNAVRYTWLMERGVKRFFGDPAPIQRDYLLAEHQELAKPLGFGASVHIQVGVVDALEEAKWVDSVAKTNLDWPMKQVVFCDLTAPDLGQQLDEFQKLASVVGVRQIVGRSAEEDAKTGTNTLLSDSAFLAGLREAAARGLSFDLQLTPPLMAPTANLLEKVPELDVALCHAGSPHDRTLDGIASWANELKALSAQPNITCKISGLGMFAHGWTGDDFRPIVEECLDQFGANRCMFGSNFPVCSLTSDYSTLVMAIEDIIPASAKNQVLNTTAKTFYFK